MMNTVTNPHKKTRLIARAALLGTIPALALGLTGCNQSEPVDGGEAEAGDVLENELDADVNEDVADVYDGPYDEDLYNYVQNDWANEQVTVSAKVNEILSPEVFTIAGTDDTTVDPLPILHQDPLDDLARDLVVRVTGIARVSFDIATVEEEMGIDLDDELFGEWEGQPYIEASVVDTTVDD